jgi:hypothetical protein
VAVAAGVALVSALAATASPALAGARRVEGRAYLLTGDEKLKFKTGDLGKTVDPGFQMVVAFPPEVPGGFLLQEFEVEDDGEEPAEPPPTLSGTYDLDKGEREVEFDLGSSEDILREQLRDFIEEEVFGEDVEGDVVIDEFVPKDFEAKLDKRFKKMRLAGKFKLRASSESRAESWVVIYKLELAGRRVPIDSIE